MESDLEKRKPQDGGEEDPTENAMGCADSFSEIPQVAKNNSTNLPEEAPMVPVDAKSKKSPAFDSSSEDLKGSCAKRDSNTNKAPTLDSRSEESKGSTKKSDNTNKSPSFVSYNDDAKGSCVKTDNNTNEGPTCDSRSEDSKESCAKSAEAFQDCSSEIRKEVLHESGERENARVVSGRFNHEVVQIKAQKAEIDRRIMAFMERKQAEINENNVREFCNVIQCNQENSCARTDAVFTPYPGFKSRVKVSRVVNTYGPLTRPERGLASCSKASTQSRDCGNQAVEERLQNMEAHLRLQTGGPVPKDVYQRIKRLEQKILELEGISPEYFQTPGFSGKRRKLQAEQSCSLVEIDDKIVALREKLARKAGELHSRNGDKFRG